MCFLFSGFRFGFRFGSGKNGTHGKFRFGKLQIQISMTSEFATCQIWIWDLFLPQTKIILPFHLFHLRLLWTENVRQKMFGRKCSTENVRQKMFDRQCLTENAGQKMFDRKCQTEYFQQKVTKNFHRNFLTANKKKSPFSMALSLTLTTFENFENFLSHFLLTCTLPAEISPIGFLI